MAPTSTALAVGLEVLAGAVVAVAVVATGLMPAGTTAMLVLSQERSLLDQFALLGLTGLTTGGTERHALQTSVMYTAAYRIIGFLVVFIFNSIHV